MSLPKTYWNNLSEEAQIQFFNFYIFTIQGELEERVRPVCASTWEYYTTEADCENLCCKLFKNIGFSAGYHCPCHAFYGYEAFLALEKALIDNGWIEEDCC